MHTSSQASKGAQPAADLRASGEERLWVQHMLICLATHVYRPAGTLQGDLGRYGHTPRGVWESRQTLIPHLRLKRGCWKPSAGEY